MLLLKDIREEGLVTQIKIGLKGLVVDIGICE